MSYKGKAVFMFFWVMGFSSVLLKTDISKDNYHLHKTCELALHKQIDEEMKAHLTYSVMAAHFNHNKVAREGFSHFFFEKAKDERNYAQKFIDYLNLRGARFAGFDIKMPGKYLWSNGLDALKDALNLEKLINNKLHYLHEIAAAPCEDQHLMDYLENHFFDQRVKSIDTIHDYISILSGMNDGTGEFLFDNQLQGEKTEL